jgi:hypothetical protein
MRTPLALALFAIAAITTGCNTPRQLLPSHPEAEGGDNRGSNPSPGLSDGSPSEADSSNVAPPGRPDADIAASNDAGSGASRDAPREQDAPVRATESGADGSASSSPDSSPACMDACSIGSKTCAGGGIQECVMLSGGCTGWNAGTTCDDPKLCKPSGAANATCECPPGTCTTGSKRCGLGGGIQQCVTNGACSVWGPESPCPDPQKCKASGNSASCACTAGGCTVGASRCGPRGGVQICERDGACTALSTESSACQFGCDSSKNACRDCSGMMNKSCFDSDCETGTFDCQGVCQHRPKADNTPCGRASCADRNNSQEAGSCQGGTCQPGKKCDYHGCGSGNKCTTTCPKDTQDSGSACEACGTSGVKCCGGTGCGPNLFCEPATLVCQPCGGDGQPCCPNRMCRDSRVCFDGFSGPPGVCNTPCGQFLQRCCNTNFENPLACQGTLTCDLDSKCR